MWGAILQDDRRASPVANLCAYGRFLASSPASGRRTRPARPVAVIKTTIRISNKLGLHARASAKLTKLAAGFRCEIHMTRNGRRVNAKSIMGVMMLAAGIGSEVDIETDGEDEAEGMNALVALIEDKFGEGQ